jgi:O-antigen ligase
MIQWLDVQRRVGPLYAGYTDFYVYPSDLFLSLTLGLGFLALVIGGKKIKRGPWYFFFPLAALVALSFISAPMGIDPALTLYHSVRLLGLFGLYIVVVNTPLRAEWVVVPLVLAVMVQGSVGILQFARQSSLGLSDFGELSLNPATTGISILRIGDARFLRAYGLTEHPNLLGGLLAFALVYLLGYYLAPAHGRARYLVLAPLALGIVALFFTFSRSAQLAFGIAAFVLVLTALRDAAQRRRHLLDTALAALLCTAVLVVPIVKNQQLLWQRAGQNNAFTDNVGEQRSLDEREQLIESANRIFYQHQLLGVGTGALPLAMYFLDTEFPRNQYDFQPAHLVVLDAAAELGIVGGGIWLWLMVVPLLVMWRQRAKMISHAWLGAVAVAVIVTLIVGFFDYYTWLWQAGRLWQWIAWGLLAAFFTVVPSE